MSNGLKDKKVGDNIVVYYGYSASKSSIACTVEKVGRKYLHATVEGKKMLFCRETGTLRVRYWRPEMGHKEACWSPEWRAYPSEKGKTIVDKQESMLRRAMGFFSFEIDPRHEVFISKEDLEKISDFLRPIINRSVSS